MARLWTVKDLAEFLSVKPGTVYAWIKARSVPHIVLHRGQRKSCVRFRPSEIERWLERRSRKARKSS